MVKDKCYIGKVEAFEYCMEHNIDTLPNRGKEVVTVHAIAEGKENTVIGRDKDGFYIGVFEV